MPFRDYRKLFPVTAQKIYLNHAAISPLSTRVTDRLDEFIDERSFGKIDTFKTAEQTRQHLREMLAEMINGRARDIALIQNTSEGFNHLVNGLTWRAGDEIILTEVEFPSNIYPFKNLERFGVVIKYAPQKEGEILITDIERLITPKTRLLSISFVEFSNGFRNDLATIGALCKAHDIIFSVDAIQGLGALPLDVQKCHIDFLSNGGHKWLMGLMGAGFMYIAPSLFAKLQPAFTGWLAVEDAWDFLDYRMDLLPDARRFEYATANFMGITALEASVALLLQAGIGQIEQHVLSLGERLVPGLENLGMRFEGSRDRRRWSGIYSFSGKQTGKLYEYLQEKQIVVSLRNGMIRIAPHFYNTADEIEELIDVCTAFYKRASGLS